jgi:hypothetical protein
MPGKTYYEMGFDDQQINDWIFGITPTLGGLSEVKQAVHEKQAPHPLEIDPVFERDAALREAAAHCVASMGPSAEIFAPFLLKQYCMDSLKGVKLYNFPTLEKPPVVDPDIDPLPESKLITVLDVLMESAGLRDKIVKTDLSVSPPQRPANCRKYLPSNEPEVYFMEPPIGLPDGKIFIHCYAGGNDGKHHSHEATSMMVKLHRPHPTFSQLTDLGYKLVHLASLQTGEKIGDGQLMASAYRMLNTSIRPVTPCQISLVKGLPLVTLPRGFTYECICGRDYRGVTDINYAEFAFNTQHHVVGVNRIITVCPDACHLATSLPKDVIGYTTQFGPPVPVYARASVVSLHRLFECLGRVPPERGKTRIKPARWRKGKRPRPPEAVVAPLDMPGLPGEELHDESGNYLDYDLGSDMID